MRRASAKQPAATSRIEERRRAAHKSGSETYARRRQQILDGATDVIRRKGFEAFTLSDVAAAAKVDRASVYYYFRDKEEVFREVVGSAGEELVKEGRRISRLDRDAPTKLRLLLGTLITCFESNLPYSSLFAAEARNAHGPWAQGGRRQQRILRDCAIEIVEQGQRDGAFRSDLDPDLLSRLIMGAVDAGYGMLKPGEGQRITDGLCGIVFDGLLSRPS